MRLNNKVANRYCHAVRSTCNNGWPAEPKVVNALTLLGKSKAESEVVAAWVCRILGQFNTD